ncbi:MAG: cobalt-precorrin-5B (C(1))-methyltransferase CbiD [Elainellaceae cyanobacterium]
MNINESSTPRAGYTLPVFACAAAIAALHKLRDPLKSISSVAVDLLSPSQTVDIPIEQAACLNSDTALAITRSDPGDNLDLTRDTPIWAHVAWGHADQAQPIELQGGEGIGQTQGQPAIYAYARRLMSENLSRWLHPDERLCVTLILPEGRSLAERTSNAAFGIVEGLSLLGTTGIAQPLSAPGQLTAYRDDLRHKAAQQPPCLMFCVGENGLELARQMGVRDDQLIKTANWLGPLLVEAGLHQVRAILLFGYHGKLIKLAGGIFHTHHHVADGRLEILTAHCANQGLSSGDLNAIFSSPTTEAALSYLRELDKKTESHWVKQVYGAIAQQIDTRSQTYIHKHSGQHVAVGSIVFDRDRQIIRQSDLGATLLSQVC